MAVDLVVVGLGYVGLPLAQAAAGAGLQVRGLDLNTDIVDGLNAGRSHVDDLSDADIATMLKQGFAATTDAAVIADADAIVICVPTPLSDEGGPDLGAVLSATRSIAKHLRAGPTKTCAHSSKQTDSLRARTSVWRSRRSASIRAMPCTA